MAAAGLTLSAADVAELDAIGEAVGDRYGHGMVGTHNMREKMREDAKGRRRRSQRGGAGGNALKKRISATAHETV